MYQSVTSPRLLTGYYAATGLFLLLDLLAGINVRVAFLEPWPAWRVAYYGLCLGCFGLIQWRPSLSLLVSTAESLFTLCALIITMGARVMGPSVGAVVSVEEILNFIIAGGVAWIGWFRGTRALRREMRP
jgi:hypothetical protein